jgi:hypothetical protein
MNFFKLLAAFLIVDLAAIYACATNEIVKAVPQTASLKLNNHIFQKHNFKYYLS